MKEPIITTVDPWTLPEGYLARVQHARLGYWRATIVDEQGRRVSATGTAPGDWRAAVLNAVTKAAVRYAERYLDPNERWTITPIAFCEGDAKAYCFVVVSIRRGR